MFWARPGAGFVGSTYLLIAPEDLQNTTTTTTATTAEVRCRACEQVLGTTTSGAGVRIPKWNIAVNGAKQPLSKFVAVELLESVDAHATYHFLLLPRTGISEALRIWIFNPSLYVTLGVAHSNAAAQPPTNENEATAPAAAPTRVMKVFYRVVVHDENTPTPTEKEEENVETLTYTNDVLDVIREALRVSTARLPLSLRKFGAWDVGYLERFD
ncbi:hypothetical protein YB2330_002001 [Saitoella coloradoensis]